MNGDLLRCDGRLPQEMRRMEMGQEYIENRPFVSFSQGNTRVRTSILANKDKGQFCVNINFSELSRNEPMNDRKVYEIKSKLTAIFQPIVLTDSQVEVNVEVMEDDGSLFSVLVNSISLCLCFCGVVLKDMCCAITLNDKADLCSEEENKGYACTVVLSANLGTIYFLESVGRFQRKDLENAILSAFGHVRIIHDTMRKFLNEHANK